jgi:hypothetical protein
MEGRRRRGRARVVASPCLRANQTLKEEDPSSLALKQAPPPPPLTEEEVEPAAAAAPAAARPAPAAAAAVAAPAAVAVARAVPAAAAAHALAADVNRHAGAGAGAGAGAAPAPAGAGAGAGAGAAPAVAAATAVAPTIAAATAVAPTIAAAAVAAAVAVAAAAGHSDDDGGALWGREAGAGRGLRRAGLGWEGSGLTRRAQRLEEPLQGSGCGGRGAAPRLPPSWRPAGAPRRAAHLGVRGCRRERGRGGTGGGRDVRRGATRRGPSRFQLSGAEAASPRARRRAHRRAPRRAPLGAPCPPPAPPTAQQPAVAGGLQARGAGWRVQDTGHGADATGARAPRAAPPRARPHLVANGAGR